MKRYPVLYLRAMESVFFRARPADGVAHETRSIYLFFHVFKLYISDT